MKTRAMLLTGLVLSLSLVYCGDTTTDPTGDGLYEYVSPGKMDDYRSTTGLEYVLMALDTVTLDEVDLGLEGEERLARASELVSLRFKALSFFLYAYLAGKSSHDENYGYGGFRTTIRQQTFESGGIQELDDQPGTFEFLFEAECAGPPELFEQIPLNPDHTFALTLPILSNAELDSGSFSRTYANFNPEGRPAETLTELMIEISPQDSEPDAYPEYDQLFADGLFDVAIHVGGDYNDSRYDLSTARDLFGSLQSDLGLAAPVATFEELTSQSGPFTGSINAGGRQVRIEVYLYHPDMNQEAGVGYQGLLDLYRQSAATRDVVLYDGHAGYDSNYSGVVVHYNPRHAIAADDFAELSLPDRYQLFMFNGCKTYTSYPDALYANPAKSTSNLDIISTVNFSWLSEMTRVTTDLLGYLLRTNAEGEHLPMSYDQILGELNQGRSWDVIYGVHGLSDNPRLSPYADEASLCQGCETNADCPGSDSLCLVFEGGARGCTAACTDDSGCPAGYRCSPAAEIGTNLISVAQCVPAAGACL